MNTELVSPKHFRIFIDDPKYTSWRIMDMSNNENIDLCGLGNPLGYKLLNNDILHIKQSAHLVDGSVIPFDAVQIVSSSNRNQVLTGVLLIDRTFGKKGNKFFYRCIPHDKHLPEFIIPYAAPREFIKANTPLYICFRFSDWNNKHPVGTIVKTIGNIRSLNNFYEYHVCCKNLDFPIREFKNHVHKSLAEISETPADLVSKIAKQYNIEDRTEYLCYTIDNKDTTEFDDAFSLWTNQRGNQVLSIYISNVAIWMEYLDLWTAFSQRIATIYLPDQKRPMIPTMLSSTLCSLIENQDRIAFTMDVEFYSEQHKESCNAYNITYKNSLIRVAKNLDYSEIRSSHADAKTNLENYFDRIYSLINKHEITKDRVSCRRDLVYFLMVFMNHNVAKTLIQHKIGIYRNVNVGDSHNDIPDSLPSEVYQYLRHLKNTIGQYVSFSDVSEHKCLKLDSYLHITSPIRRLVDLLNIIAIHEKLGFNNIVGNKARMFYENWSCKLQYINTTMRAIRKVQNDCRLLSLFEEVDNREQLYTGYVFDRIKRIDGQYQYNLYIPKLRMNSRLTCFDKYENYSQHNIHLYMFSSEFNVKKKIKANIIS